MDKLKIGILVGSARKASYCGQVARIIAGQLPERLTPIFIEMEQLALYNQDYDDEGNVPAAWTAFREEAAGCDGFLFITPEYNRSVPALLKNAIDIGSRPYGHNLWGGKPAAVVSLSPGKPGGIMANYHLRQILSLLGALTMAHPEVAIGEIHQLLGEDGSFKNADTASFVAGFVRSFGRWMERFQK